MKSSHPEAKLWEIGKIIGNMWRDLSEAERNEFNGDYEIAKVDKRRRKHLINWSISYLIENTD